MRWFLDMCILIYYASKDNSLFYKKTIEFLKKNEGEKLLVCHYIIEWDLPKWIKRQNTLVDEVVKKVKDPNYDLDSSFGWNSLYSREKQKGEKLIFKAKNIQNKAEFIRNLLDYQKEIEIRIFYFIKQKAEKVIQLSEIDKELKSQLFTYLNNNVSDANIIASGIQEHNKKEVIFMTADRSHWTKENLEWALPEHSPLRKKYPNLPEIRYIQDS
jgi:hypothetical protein